MIFWVSSVPFTTSTKTRGRSGPVVVKGDDWGGYRSERGEITRFVKENHVTNLMVIGGDAHCLAAGNGEHTATYVKGGIPIPEIIAAPLLNSHKSAKGGPWSQGTSGAARKSEQLGYGLVTIEQDQTRITVTFSGRDTNQKEHVSLKVAYAKRK